MLHRMLTKDGWQANEQSVKYLSFVYPLIFVSLIGSQVAFAQDELADDIDAAPEVAMEEGKSSPFEKGAGGPPGGLSFYSLELSGGYLPEADMDGKSGSLSEQLYEASIAWNRFAGFDNISRVSFTYTRREYDVSGEEPYAGSFDETNAFRIGGTFQRPIGDKWSAFVTSGVSVQSAGGAKLTDGWNVPFSAGIGYMFSPQLLVSAGVLGILEAELGARVIPIAAIRWMPNDRFTLMTLNGVRATYKMGARKEWEILGSVLYETFVFAVDDLEGFTREQGVVSQEYWQTRLGLNRNFGRMFTVGLFLESRFNRKFEYYDNDKEFDQFDVDPTLGLRLVGTYRF